MINILINKYKIDSNNNVQLNDKVIYYNIYHQ